MFNFVVQRRRVTVNDFFERAQNMGAPVTAFVVVRSQRRYQRVVDQLEAQRHRATERYRVILVYAGSRAIGFPRMERLGVSSS